MADDQPSCKLLGILDNSTNHQIVAMAKSLVKWWPICFVVVFAGCATMTPEQCKNADWSEVGRRDGLDGHSMTTLDARISDCKVAGVAVDTGRYVIGREQGLLTYCQLDNAVVLGLSGAGYEGACPPMIDEAFRRVYEKGRSVFEWRTEISRLENRSEVLSRRLSEIGYEERRLIAEAGKEEDRKRVLKEFDQRRQQLRMELFGVDRSLQRARDALRSAEITLRNP